MRQISPHCKKLTAVLREFTSNFPSGNLHIRLLTPIKKYFKEYGCIRYHYLKKMDINAVRHFQNIFKGAVYTSFSAGTVSVRFCVSNMLTTRQNSLLTDYYFTGILICGDIIAEELMVSIEQSELYSFGDTNQKNCEMVFNLPVLKPWLLLLKIACFEGNQQAVNPKNYAMRIIATGYGYNQ
ncbi:MAG: hypothetical protein EOO04_31920 [Chitinophagaceae bacterium]|nr:MAG: hypothetical protein EOO04_31920 [Chitinophagaceae bacterium]